MSTGEVSRLVDEAQKSQVRHFLLCCGVIIFALLLSIVGAEIYLRHKSTHIVQSNPGLLNGFVTHPDLLIRHTPNGRRLIPNADVMIKNHFVSKQDIPMKINSHGFRDKEIAVTKKINEFRIIVLGDSITWGDYLPVDDVYVARIEKYVNPHDNFDIQVINAGVGDVGLKEEINILLEKGLLLNPDVVIVAFYLNDSRPSWGFPREIGHRGWLRRHSVLVETLYRQFRLKQWVEDKGVDRFRWIKQFKENKLNWRDNRQDFLQLAESAEYDWGAAWKKDSWDIVKAEFRGLKSLSEIHSFQVILLALPVAFQVYASFHEDYPQKMLQEIAVEHGFYYIDLLPVLRKYRTEDLFFDYCHLKKKPNDIIGKEIAMFLKKILSKRGLVSNLE